MHISEKEVARRQLRLAFDEMQHSSGVARSWYEENMTQMRSSWRAERVQFSNQFARATEVVAG
eukprot:1776985-Lingulodinium_polyedra.AAC.1